MNEIHLPVGTRLEVSWPDAQLPGAEMPAGAPVYVSQVLEPFQGGKMVIAVPISGFRLVRWPAGCRMKIVFTQKDTGVWSFTAILARPMEADQIAAWEIEPADDLVRVQRREWYRLPCILDLSFETDEDTEAAARQPCRAVTRDISGGGMRLVSGLPLREKSRIEATIRFDDRAPIKVRGRIIRSQDLESPDVSRHMISVQFTDIPPREQAALNQFILRRQREELRRRRTNIDYNSE